MAKWTRNGGAGCGLPLLDDQRSISTSTSRLSHITAGGAGVAGADQCGSFIDKEGEGGSFDGVRHAQHVVIEDWRLGTPAAAAVRERDSSAFFFCWTVVCSQAHRAEKKLQESCKVHGVRNATPVLSGSQLKVGVSFPSSLEQSRQRTSTDVDGRTSPGPCPCQEVCARLRSAWRQGFCPRKAWAGHSDRLHHAPSEATETLFRTCG